MSSFLRRVKERAGSFRSANLGRNLKQYALLAALFSIVGSAASEGILIAVSSRVSTISEKFKKHGGQTLEKVRID